VGFVTPKLAVRGDFAEKGSHRQKKGSQLLSDTPSRKELRPLLKFFFRLPYRSKPVEFQPISPS
jgi:hypothetical protein